MRRATSSSSSPGTRRTGRAPGTACAGCPTTAPTRSSATTTPGPRPTPGRSPSGCTPTCPRWRRRPATSTPRCSTRTLPAEVVDAVTSTLVVLRSTTCLLLDDGSPGGRFAAWEGSFDHAGSCEGTCTHVWGYAQTAAWLFPALERERPPDRVPGRDPARRADEVPRQLRLRQHPDGVPPGGRRPAGQCGPALPRMALQRRRRLPPRGVAGRPPRARVRLHHLGLRRRLRARLPAAQHLRHRVLRREHARQLDLLRRPAGRAPGSPSTWARPSSPAAGSRPPSSAPPGPTRVLCNGEYYRQRIDDVDAHRYQYGEGCLSDQLLGQTHAHLNGLGHLLPPDHVRSAVGAIFEHNFRARLQRPPQRAAHVRPERRPGLVLCTWPRGGRPRIPFVYSDEVWTGIEYQVATHLIYDGLVERGPGDGPRGPRPARRRPPQPVERGGVRQPLRPVAGQLGRADRPDRCAVGRERPEPVDRAPGRGAAGRRAALLLQHRRPVGASLPWRTAGRRCGSSAARSTWPRRRSSIPSSVGSGLPCRDAGQPPARRSS